MMHLRLDNNLGHIGPQNFLPNGGSRFIVNMHRA